MIINAPSLANCDFLTMGEQVEELAAGGCQWFHVDIMDGHYVPNLCFPVRLVRELKTRYPQVVCDVHLMTDDPMSYLPELREAGADYVSFHMDATRFAWRTLAAVREMGMRPGVVINPSQCPDVVEPVLEFLDYVVLMTVEPGYAGQRFLEDSVGRLGQLTEIRRRSGRHFLISIDGGVDYPHAISCAKLGAEVFVTGIYTVFNQADGIARACGRFRQTLEGYAPDL